MSSFSKHAKTLDAEILYKQAEEETVKFKIKGENSSSQDGTDTWTAIYTSDGKNIKFLIRLLIKESSEENKYPFSVGTISTEKSEENQLFLKEVIRKFKIKDPIISKEKKPLMGFETAILGTNLYKGVGNNLLAGKFTDDKEGKWLVVKAFVGEKNSEFYLALNNSEALGEIYPKDPEYNQEVIKELSKIF